MAEIKPAVKRWDEMETDVLVKIFKELNMIELAPVSQVCRSWRAACSDPLLWDTFDLGLLKSNFIQTRASPYIWVDERSDRRLTKLLRIAMALSRGNITCLIFHFNLYMKDDHLSYISERFQGVLWGLGGRSVGRPRTLRFRGVLWGLGGRSVGRPRTLRCPHLKRLVMPAWNRITKIGISKAVRIWKNLESLTMPSIAHPPYIIKEISKHCENFSSLKIMGTFNMRFAAAIACNLPNLKTLSLRCSIISREALLFILDCIDRLEVLNISHCLMFESLTSVGRKHNIRELDCEILVKVSRLREFYHCMSRSCRTCQRMTNDEGLMRWYRYEGSFWREDEVRSLAIGEDYGKLFDKGCLDLGFSN